MPKIKGDGSVKKRALISVSDKTGVVDFAKKLSALDYEILSTGGTYATLKDAGVSVISVSEVTKFPELLDGRVKTLHPAIHGGLLAKRDDIAHMQQLKEQDIAAIDLVAVNLYPFQETIRKPEITQAEAIEQIDIGGPCMLRAAAKNHASVTVVVDPADYDMVLEMLANGEIPMEKRIKLAAKVFRHTAAYDAVIADFFTEEMFPERLTITYEKQQNLRYGENPQQAAALYKSVQKTGGILSAKQLHGKELSYNNIADADTALNLVCEFDLPAAVAIKHANPCGVGLGAGITEAYQNAYAADPVSIFGGIVALNREVDESCAMLLRETFLEIIIAPAFSDAALNILREKKNLRLLQADMQASVQRMQLSSVTGGLLLQQQDTHGFAQADITVPTIKKPSEAQLRAAKFAWTVVKYVKSNAIVIATEKQTLGIGPGQTNRVGAAQIAITQAGAAVRGAVLASDAFLPMADTVELAAKAGVSVIIQPGGSVKDEDSIKTCDAHGIAMVFTGIRHFRH